MANILEAVGLSCPAPVGVARDSWAELSPRWPASRPSSDPGLAKLLPSGRPSPRILSIQARSMSCIPPEFWLSDLLSVPGASFSAFCSEFCSDFGLEDGFSFSADSGAKAMLSNKIERIHRQTGFGEQAPPERGLAVELCRISSKHAAYFGRGNPFFVAGSTAGWLCLSGLGQIQ